MQNDASRSVESDAVTLARAFIPIHPAALLTEGQAADVLSISVRTLQAWRVRGGGPRFVAVGRAVRYRNAELIDFVESRTRTSTSDPGPAAPAVGG